VITRFFVPVLAAITVLAAVTAQTPPQKPPPDQRQVFRAEANLVRVDATVIRNGEPVTNLTAADFEVREDGVLQKIEEFEYVRVDRPQSAIPIEPSNSAAAFEAAQDPRSRLFIFLLDMYHVTQENSLQTPMALVRMIDNLIAPTDFFGIMTPDMRIRDLILGRKTDVVRSGLLQNRRWGRMQEDCRDRGNLDQVEKMYTVCYPPPPPPPGQPACDIGPTALNLIRRRREAFTLGVMRDLVRYIGAGREARTSFILVTEGWALYRPNDGLANVGAANPPTIRIGPGGTLSTKDPRDYNVDQQECARHVREVAQADHWQLFRDIIEDARRNNAGFYVVDPGGLRAAPMAGMITYPGTLDMRRFRDHLLELADNTDGRAIVNTNDISTAMLKVVDDLSGYYLMGYYSSNTKPDGRFRQIDVKVAKPNVTVRARRGYYGFTKKENESIATARAAVEKPPDPGAVAHAEALGRLARLKPNTAFYVNGVVDAARGELLVAGELSFAAARGADWKQGADAQILVSAADGTPAGSGRATIAAGGRAFLARVPLGRAASGGEFEVAVRLRASGGPASLLESTRAAARTDPIGDVLAFRSAGAENPVATFLWWRTEAIRFEAPLAPGAAVPTGRLLDRAGNPMPVPIDVTVREDGGSRWAVATFKLGPLSPADYVLELASGEARRFVPLRVER
jgi:VWFA-related protein